MKSSFRINKTVVKLLLLAALILVFLTAAPLQARSQEVYLNVLTINLLFSEIPDRNERLNNIAQFVADYAEDIDLILLQEVVGGPLARTFNSALNLKIKLAVMGVNYQISYRMANGIPGIITVGNASRILIPDFGYINVYNTHLCAFCDTHERLTQVESMLSFINLIESFFMEKAPAVLGGDFNAEYGSDEYNQIVVENGFIDTYARLNCPDCCSQIDPTGCTFAVPCGVVPCNPYAVDPFTGLPEEAKRIDYIFVKNLGKIVSSDVVFNSEPWVSDHSGVLTKIRLK
ncbi:MAG: endonuclease/exonuclease/phosphatase family protein [Deltaproteobacteria bacterium]|nr:endonuclease/exonuclease/phosphatase family protein [Deltaproteobacteria bacterium]